MLTVEFVIRRHDRPRPGLLDCDLKGAEVYLTQCSLADNGVDALALRFLLIPNKMFNSRRYAS
jgi:hypothetical protein